MTIWTPTPAERARVRKTMGSHQSSKMLSDTWLTPPNIIEALGKFDLDPCCPPKMPWKTADVMWSQPEHDGLAEPWTGRVWLNPPYGREAEWWLITMKQHGNGIALTFARTETAWFRRAIWSGATAMLFIRDRLHFHHADGTRAVSNAGAPSVLVAYGHDNARLLHESRIRGTFVDDWSAQA